MRATDSAGASRQAGLSLIGVLIAVFLFVVSSLALAQLMAQTEHTVGLAREKFVAAALAQEGLELVQARRDSNWFAHDAAETGDCATARQPDNRDECWLENLCAADGQSTAGDHHIIIDQDPASGITVIHAPTEEQQWLYLASDGYWSHAVSEQRSPYQRRVMLDCSTQTGEAAAVTVTSEVRWQSRQQERAVAISERLYNWYKED